MDALLVSSQLCSHDTGIELGAGAPLGLFDNVCGAKDAGQGSVLGDSEFGFPSLTVGCRDQFRGSGLSRLVVLGPRCCATAGGSLCLSGTACSLLFLSLLPSRRLCPDSTVAVTGRVGSELLCLAFALRTGRAAEFSWKCATCATRPARFALPCRSHEDLVAAGACESYRPHLSVVPRRSHQDPQLQCSAIQPKAVLPKASGQV